MSYSACETNWADHRDTDKLEAFVSGKKTHGFGCAWCHGAPGIGLGRLRIRELLGTTLLDSKLHDAATATHKHLGGRNAGLCHGEYGLLAFLEAYYNTFTNTQDKPTGEVTCMADTRLTQKFTESAGTRQFLGKIGFMNGLCGVGYSIIRRQHRMALPDILTLSM